MSSSKYAKFSILSLSPNVCIELLYSLYFFIEIKNTQLLFASDRWESIIHIRTDNAMRCNQAYRKGFRLHPIIINLSTRLHIVVDFAFFNSSLRITLHTPCRYRECDVIISLNVKSGRSFSDACPLLIRAVTKGSSGNNIH